MKSKSVAIISISLVAAMLALPATSHAWRGGWGWGWGPGAFVGGALLGAVITAPYYAYPPPAYYPPPPAYYPPPPAYYPPPAYAYPSPPPAYAPNQTYANPGPPPASGTAAVPQMQGKGRWVDVPGQMVSNTWVPAHKVWVPDSANSQSGSNAPAGDQSKSGFDAGSEEGP